MDKLIFYEKMLKIRNFELKALELYSKNLIRGSMHSYIGEEAIAVGVCSALEIKKGDGITSNHRGHGHYLAMGGDLNLMMAELLGKFNGCCKGKGGSMHIADIDVGIYGANGIVGGGIPIACGLSLASTLKGKDSVSATFFGDGASNQGVLYESLNMASIWNLPVIFICENNKYAQTTPASQTLAGGSVAGRSNGFNIKGIKVDGMDIEKVYEVAKNAIDKTRVEKRPILIEAETYRFKGHWQGDPEMYRSKEEVNDWMKRDPIKIYENELIKKYNIDLKVIENIKKKVEKEILDAEEFAMSSPEPPEDSLYEDIYS